MIRTDETVIYSLLKKEETYHRFSMVEKTSKKATRKYRLRSKLSEKSVHIITDTSMNGEVWAVVLDSILFSQTRTLDSSVLKNNKNIYERFHFKKRFFIVHVDDVFIKMVNSRQYFLFLTRMIFGRLSIQPERKLSKIESRKDKKPPHVLPCIMRHVPGDQYRATCL